MWLLVIDDGDHDSHSTGSTDGADLIVVEAVSSSSSSRTVVVVHTSSSRVVA